MGERRSHVMPRAELVPPSVVAARVGTVVAAANRTMRPVHHGAAQAASSTLERKHRAQ